MNRTEIKERAEDELMSSLANALLIFYENQEMEIADNQAIFVKMKQKAKAIGKQFGYASWPGIF